MVSINLMAIKYICDSYQIGYDSYKRYGLFQVCCPDPKNIDDYEANKDNVDNETDEYNEYYDYEHVYDCDNVLPPIVCPADSSCVTRTECGRKGMGLFMEVSIDGGRTLCHFFISETKRDFGQVQ